MLPSIGRRGHERGPGEWYDSWEPSEAVKGLLDETIIINDGIAMSESITYRLHAVQRMFKRKISAEEVRYVLETGEVIEEYPDDTPYPSRLIVGCYKGRLIHIVEADNFDDDEIIVITVYEPDTSEWDPDCRKRI
jgi:hypothetical protein